jgi:nicotinate-nucleotide pyrophosphorylase (carboxylating)
MSLPSELDSSELAELVREALAEDLGVAGDITTARIVGADRAGKAHLIAKSPGILAGVPIVEEVFRQVEQGIHIDWARRDGEAIVPATVVATLFGSARGIMAGERVALNFLQHLSGVATATSRLAVICSRYGVRLLCTRKTLPGLRTVQRYAVKVGGGYLHRAGLFDAILIKTNHLKLAGGISEALRLARTDSKNAVEVEVTSIEELGEAMVAGADSILLDNADLKTIELAVKQASGRASLEVSGGVTMENIAEIARLGPDAISVGRITHSVEALDMALHFENG